MGARALYREMKARALDRKVHLTRRIDSVKTERRLVAITFDDGPCAGPALPHREPVTPMILKTLRQFDARGTFDIIGTTAFKYPDEEGKSGGPYWNGVFHDHYPAFNEDLSAGAVNQKGLLKRIVEEGHELSNHGFTHMPFGPCRYPYAKRRYLQGYDAVLADLKALHDYVAGATGFEMKLGRPPHYIDKMRDGFDAYDAYRAMGYLYLGASFDGGGWKPSTGDFEKDLDEMVRPLESILKKDADALCGAIIFHKDGYNMNGQAPAPFGLKRQLEILRRHDYKVVTVSQLLSFGQFADIGPEHPGYEASKALALAGFKVAFASNRVRPDEKVTVSSFTSMCVPESGVPYGWETVPHLLELQGGKGPVTSKAVHEACSGFLQKAALGEDERKRRMGLLLRIKGSGGEETATRGLAARYLAAAFLGI